MGRSKRREIHLLAAYIYRDLRKRGVTVPSVDAAVAAIDIHHGFPLFARDDHFMEIARQSKLELFT